MKKYFLILLIFLLGVKASSQNYDRIKQKQIDSLNYLKDRVKEIDSLAMTFAKQAISKAMFLYVYDEGNFHLDEGYIFSDDEILQIHMQTQSPYITIYFEKYTQKCPKLDEIMILFNLDTSLIYSINIVNRLDSAFHDYGYHELGDRVGYEINMVRQHREPSEEKMSSHEFVAELKEFFQILNTK